MNLRKICNEKKYYFLALLLVIFLGGVKYFYYSPPKITPLNSSAYFEWDNCEFKKPLLSIIYCGHFYSSTDKADEKVQHKLPVVLFRQFSFFKKHYPIIYLSGGPGGSNRLDSEGIKDWIIWLKENNWKNDFLVFEQRGIGKSVPSYSCPELIKNHKKYVSKNLSVDEELELFNNLNRKCYEDLIEKGADLKNINTIKFAEDALGIMSSLDYEQWNIYSVSYGTKLAIEILRQDSSLIRSVVLDSIYPKYIVSLQEWPKLLFENMDKIIKACEKMKGCNRKYENLSLIFDMLLEKLRYKSDKFVIKDYYSDEDVDFVLNDSRFLDVLFETSYTNWGVKFIPKLLVEYFNGNNSLMKEAIENTMYVYWDETFSDPVYSSVECHDNKDISELDYNNLVSKYPKTSEYVQNLWKYDECHYWESGKAKDNFYKEIEPSVPILILSSSFDPITPAEWAYTMREKWKNSFHVNMKGAGHGVVDNHLCGAWVVSEFIDDPSKKPNPKCLNQLEFNSMVFD